MTWQQKSTIGEALEGCMQVARPWISNGTPAVVLDFLKALLLSHD